MSAKRGEKMKKKSALLSLGHLENFPTKGPIPTKRMVLADCISAARHFTLLHKLTIFSEKAA